MKSKERSKFVVRARAEYARVSAKKEKGALIDAVIQLVGYKSRKQVIRILGSRRNVRERKKTGRSKILSPQQVDMLRQIWSAMGYPCGKRMQPMLAEWVEGWEKWHGALPKPFPSLSAATLDRELSAFKLRKATQRVDLIHLTHLKKSIPYVDLSKQPTQPGHLSADTVAHCNGDMSGDFVWTLTVTDELTGWTQNRAIWNKGQYATC